MTTANGAGLVSLPKFPAVLLAAGNRGPLSARLAIALLHHGCVVSAICPSGHPLRYVSGVKKIYTYSALASRGSLVSSIRHAKPDLIVPCDDYPVAQLHEVHRLFADVRQVVERSLGRPEGFAVLESRHRLLETARELGIRVPWGCRVTSAEHAGSCYVTLGRTALLKLNGSSGGEGVRIVRSAAEAVAQFRQLDKALRVGTTVKRLIIDRNPLALWAWRLRRSVAITMQEFIEGTPANIMVACWRGQILGQVSVQAVSCQGPTGAANVVRVIANEELSRAAASLAAHLGISGFFGLDFILEKGTGAPYLIEMNPRCTQLGHLRLAQGDLAGALCANLAEPKRPNSNSPIECDTIAFFPQARQWGTTSDYLRKVHHDVPWEEKQLVEYLTREPWPDRRWLARVYHMIRRPTQVKAVEFDTEPTVTARQEEGIDQKSGSASRRLSLSGVHPVSRRAKE